MAINFTDAVSAYQKIARQDTLPGFESRAASAQDDFAAVLRDATEGAVGSLREGESQSMKAAAGAADLEEEKEEAADAVAEDTGAALEAGGVDSVEQVEKQMKAEDEAEAEQQAADEE